MKEKIKRTWIWLKQNIFKADMIVFIFVAEFIFWLPVITLFILGLFNAYFFIPMGAIIAFWSGPFTPAMPIQFALALAIKKCYYAIKAKWQKNSKLKIEQTK